MLRLGYEITQNFPPEKQSNLNFIISERQNRGIIFLFFDCRFSPRGSVNIFIQLHTKFARFFQYTLIIRR